MSPPLTIVRCPKCGDPSPWHREPCTLTWREGDREATAQFPSPDEATTAAHRLLADSAAEDLAIYDLDGVALTITCVGCGITIDCGRTMTDHASGAVRFCCEACYARLRTELEG